MKVYISASQKDAEHKQTIEDLCSAVRKAGLVDFCFIRDIQHYKNSEKNPKQLWAKVYDEIGASDAFLIDVSGHPTSSRLVEMGIAYALRKPVIVIERNGTHHKELFYGVSSDIIKYSDYDDLAKKLKKFEKDRNFNLTDKLTLFAMFLLLGGVISWEASLLYAPIGFVVAIVYWFFVRHFFASMRAFDRIVIYIPLFVVWLTIAVLLKPIDVALAIAWTMIYWAAVLLVLQKTRFSL